MKVVYYCTGECQGESEAPGVCQTEGCPKHGKPLIKTFKCPECGMHYTDKETAKKCEAWCTKYKSCNVELIKNALESQ